MAISDEFKRKVLEKDELKQILDIKVGVKFVLANNTVLKISRFRLP